MTSPSYIINHQPVLDQLRGLETVPSTDLALADTARQWIKAIEEVQKFLDDKSHNLVFIGSVGVGKSSLIGIAANLLAGPSPTDRTSLKNNSVLAIGSGRTTVCEVRIRAPRPDDGGQIGLVIQPYSIKDMENEIEIFAEDEWRRHQPQEKQGSEDDIDPSSQEIYRVIRGMTGYAEFQETVMDGKIRKRRTVDPLDKVVTQYSDASALAAHLLERANLPARDTTKWWWETYTTENLKALKAHFEAVNQGSESTAMLPYSMTVVVPQPLSVGTEDDLDMTLIDTRGLDPGSTIDARPDIQEFLRNPRAVIVLCCSFRDAPGDAIRSLLRSMAGDAQLRDTISRTLLILLDMGDADQVPGAGGDRESGQEIKVGECHRNLEGTNISRMIEKTQIIAFDTLKDDPSRLRESIFDQLSLLRQVNEKQLGEQVENARRFLNDSANVLRPALLRLVDEKLKEAMALCLPTETPLRDPLEGMYQTIRETRYASVVYATCRRNGAYSRLNLYAATQAEASRAATLWLDSLFNAVNSKLNQLEQDSTFEKVIDDIQLRKRLYQAAQINVISRYAETVYNQVLDSLKNDPVWKSCRQKWGQGDGFISKVLNNLENWSRRQQSITAHESTEAGSLIPLFSEVSKPAQAPRFELHVNNLRALHQVAWKPEPLSVLIGANGVGKTTLLQTLRLLRLAYERDLPEAVKQVLRGIGNLKTWGALEEDSVQICINLGEISWQVELVPREGSVDYVAPERLVEQGREIFSRDSLGGFYYKEERIEPSPQLGLRALMDRGIHEPALRSMARFFQRIAVYADFDLWTLRNEGSKTSEDRLLHSRGGNALTLLRRWHQTKADNHRYQFVLEGLSAAFPNTFAEMDFVEAGNTLVARIYRPGQEFPSPLADEANGVLQLLVLFCAVASAEDESVIAIDEPENSLHPYALRVFLRRTSRWARQHNLTVILATHSTVLLDELTGNPEQVFVMKSKELGEAIPTRLDNLCEIEWLEKFKLGDLYEQGEIGSNEDEA